MAEFTHLHLHTTYSMLDGAIRPRDLMAHCKEQGMSAVAMTDHGNMFGAIEFYQEAKKAGIKPIIGCEFYVAPQSRLIKKNVEAIADGGAYHLVVLARNEEGYKNLVKLASLAYTEGFYRKPRIDYEILEQYNSGLIGASACLGGEIPRKIMGGKLDEASSLAGRLKETFEPGCFFLELQDHNIEEQKLVNTAIIDIAKRNEIPIIATNDSHYLRAEDHEAQTTLLRIQTNTLAGEDLRFSFNEHFYVKNPDEMSHLFRHHPEAITNTMKIAEMCDLNLEFGNARLPNFETPGGESLNDFLYRTGMEGLKERYEVISPEVQKRFDHEYKIITGMDFAGYFLIVQDFMNYARNKGIPVGPGRGSAAGSILSYSLGITNVDPLRYDLLFERFLNPDRNEMPDIDIDFCQDRREEVIDYVREKYGDDHVSQIITFGTLSAKAVLKDVSRIFGVPYSESNAVTKMFPGKLGESLQDAYKNSDDLKNWVESDEKNQKIWNIAGRLEGGVRQAGKHAAGIVISPVPLDEIAPVFRETGTTQNVTQYEKNAVEQIGLVKMDFLGLRNLTIIDYCLGQIKRRHGKSIDINKIPMDDAGAFRLLQTGQSDGVFQLESSGMKELLMRARPQEFEDIVAVLALYRPGPLNSGMADEYVERKNGRKQVIYPHADLERVLKPTYGVIVYQEQVMLISQIIGGFSMAEADKLRKAMGKKKLDLMAELKTKFMEGAEKGGYDTKFASDIYDDMAKFAEYGFNKSHSVAYALITYQTAWLKYHYKIEYMYALLASEISNSEGLVKYIEVARSNDITILTPDVTRSEEDFTIEDDTTIRFGLAAIKGVGFKAAQAILDGRKAFQAEHGRPWTSMLELCEAVDLRQVNKKVMEALTVSGACDSLDENRRTRFEMLEDTMQKAQRSQNDRKMGQTSLFGLEEVARISNDYETYPEWPDDELLRLEKESLGFFLSGHPLDRFRRLLQMVDDLKPLPDLVSVPDKSQVRVAGMITSVRKLQTRRDSKDMATFVLEDFTGNVNCVTFPSVYESIRQFIFPDSMLMLSGQYEADENNPQLIVNQVTPLTEAMLKDTIRKDLHIVLHEESQNEVMLKNLKSLFVQHRGNSLVYFHIKNANQSKKVIQAHPHFGISLDEDFLTNLSRLISSRNMYFTMGDEIHPIDELRSA
jgi:DNA polymerase-3 subunit alpha